MKQPYYTDDYVTIYHGDCLELMCELPKVDLVLTDPPYIDYHLGTYRQTPINFLSVIPCRQFVFWSRKADFPLDCTAIHIWNKNPSNCGAEYERIYERNGHKAYKVYTFYMVNSTVAASMTYDIYTGHPSQKPIKLIRALLNESKGDMVLDPFSVPVQPPLQPNN